MNALTKPSRLARLALVLCSLALQIAPAPSQAAYPDHAIRLIVPFEPGGSTDITARIVAQQMGTMLKQSLIVENKSGAGGNIGTQFVAASAPDGYTLLWANVAPVAINPHLYAKLPYDPAKDLTPIGLATVFPNVLVVKASFPATGLQDFIAKSRNKQLKGLTYGSAGNGSSTHLASEWLNQDLGSDWLHIPYKGGGPALMAVAAGQVDMYFSSVPAALPYIKNGTLKAIGVSSKTPTAALPGVPPIASAGLPDFEALNWNGLMAPAGTPDAILQQLNDTLRAALQSPDTKAKLLAQGADPSSMTRAEFAAYIKSEDAKWARIIQLAHAHIN